jgi:hypothetical protein
MGLARCRWEGIALVIMQTLYIPADNKLEHSDAGTCSCAHLHATWPLVMSHWQHHDLALLSTV